MFELLSRLEFKHELEVKKAPRVPPANKATPTIAGGHVVPPSVISSPTPPTSSGPMTVCLSDGVRDHVVTVEPYISKRKRPRSTLND